MTDLQMYVFKSRYAKWQQEIGRRETWEETVERYCSFWKNRYPDTFPAEEMYEAIYNMEVMPSMRALMTAGPALERDNIAGYNCSYIPIQDEKCFDEVMYVLMNGTGVGFSVERQYITKLPEIPETIHESETTIVVPDSKQGWASSFRQLLALLYSGQAPRWDLSRIRPAGARLRTFGGRASGPDPLADLFRFTVALFRGARGRKLNSIECHDLVCKIAQIVVVGGVRRSALISLSNLTDERMRNAKNGAWWENSGHRALANNSVAYTEKPDIGIFMKEWHALYESKSGERGVFNRVSAKRQSAATGRRETDHEFGTNPCGEIILRPFGFCNLTEVVVRGDDDSRSLTRKVRLASILGTFQSTLTDFRYIRKQWKTNAEEERLLGVSLTGIMDSALINGSTLVGSPLGAVLRGLKEDAIATNREWAERLGIPVSAAITTVKPSGTVSQLVDSASGIHPRHNSYYIRTVRADVKDPLATFMKEKGVPCEDDVTNKSNLVFSFPVHSPNHSITRSDRAALEQLDHYLAFKRHWCEHNPSITVYVKEDEWMDVGAWVYKNMDDVGGVSFLPHSEHVYKQAPYQDITKDQYESLAANFPKLDWAEFDNYEMDEDTTVGSQEYACGGGACEIL